MREQAPHWRDPQKVLDRYHRLCEHLHVSRELYDVEIEEGEQGAISLRFRKNSYKVKKSRALFGKIIVITDNSDWTTREIIEAHLSRSEVEGHFRQSKDPSCVQVVPIRHWTDSKIRCHLFTCVVALTYLRRLERTLAAAGIDRPASAVIEDMRRLHSVLTLQKGKRKPVRRLETPTKTQAVVLSAFGHAIDGQGVLRKLSS